MRSYVDAKKNALEVANYVERLRAAEALVLVFPVWFDGLPAIMNGYFQRVFLPGVATVIDESGLFHPNLWNLKRMAAVCTYGENRAGVAKKGDPARRFVRDNIGALIEPTGRFEYLALYGTDFTTVIKRAAFQKRVARAFRAW
jgi:putative NADPH-quinone reductase